MKIKQLAPDVIKRLRSGVAVTSVSQCVEELVWNSIDAGATCIAVRLNLPFSKIQVIDNGCGIPPEQMEIVGCRYATSKCHSLHDLENLRFSGYRGEALASIKDISSILMIESRTADNEITYCKIFTQGKASRPKKSINDRPSKGTTISVFDFLYNLPVRKKSISESLDLNECRTMLQCIALMYPHLSFSLESEATRETCFQFKKSQSLPLAFAQLFGKVRVGCLKSFHHRLDDYEINGYISTDYHTSKDLQFLYVNKRYVLKTRLHKLINSLLGQVLSCKQILKVDPLKSTPESPVRSQTQFFIYVVNVTCPYSKCDVIFEPRKTMIEFSEWDKVMKVTKDAILNFLKSEKLISSVEEQPPMIVDKNDALHQNDLDFTSCANGLFSNAVKRLNPQAGPATCNVAETPQKNAKLTDFERVVPPQSISNFTDHSRQDCMEGNNHEQTSTRHVTDKLNFNLHKANPNLICLKNTKSNVSILDTLKFQGGKTKTSFSETTENSGTTSFASKAPDVPNRSVFPVKSPVMLHVPVRSTLSDLEKGKSDVLLKLKEKYNFSAKSKNKHFNLRINTSHENHLPANQVNKSNEKLKFSASGKVKNKSIQCPSLSQDIHSRLSPENAALDMAARKNKSIQCPSVQSNGKPVSDTNSILKPVSLSRVQVSTDTECSQTNNVPSANLFDKSGRNVISRFEFREESNSFWLRKSNFFNRSNRKYLSKTLHLKDDVSSNSDTSVMKKLKSCSSSNNFSPEYRYVQDEVYLNGGARNVSNYVHNSKSENDFKCTMESDTHVLSSVTTASISSDSHCESSVVNNAKLRNSNIFLQPFVNTFHDLVEDKAHSSNVMESINYGLKNDKIDGSQEKISNENSLSSTGELAVCDSGACVPVASDNPEENVNGNFKLCVNSEFFTNLSSSNENEIYDCKSCEENDFCKDKDSGSSLSVTLSHERDSKSSNSDLDKGFENIEHSSAFPAQDIEGHNSAHPTEDIEEHNTALIVEGSSDKRTNTDVISGQKSSSPECHAETNRTSSRWILQKDPVSGRIAYIDSVTGNSSYEAPECAPVVQEISGELAKGSNDGHFFLSHDFSPFLSKQSSEKLNSDNETTSSEQAELKLKLDTFVKDQENDELCRKWRMPQENSENSVEDMLVKWQNPMFEVPSDVNCVEGTKYSENLPQMYCILNSYRFSKSALENVKVIGQVDCKFIACIVSNINENNTNQNLLVLFDQHAVHERVRLEELTEELYEMDENNERIVKTYNLTSPLKLMLEAEEIRLLRTYYINLQKLGIFISFSDEADVIFVNSIPSCFVDKETSKLKRKLAEIESIIENTIKEWLNTLAKTRAASYVLPKSLCAVLNSQACRGAVKFGDPLSISECQELLVSLADCKLPFQCAHGRPSIAPILDLNKIAALCKKRSTPQLSNIKHLLNS